MNRFDDGIEEWREEMAESDDWTEQRKANYTPPEMIYEQGLEFVQREYNGVYEMLKRRAYKRIEAHEIFETDYEVKDLKREVASLGYTQKEVKAMFKGSGRASVISRELILEIPELAKYCRIRKCSISSYYPTLQDLEGSAAINTEEGGDFAA